MPNNLQIATIGDSVGWGQGLRDEHKYANIIAESLSNPPGKMFAHSGAIIGVGYNGSARTSNSEVPDPVPTILSQVDIVPDPATIDLLFVNGGINDIDFRFILDPLTSSGRLHERVVTVCYANMKTLLTNVIQKFTKQPNTIIVTGYYPILSTDSKFLRTAEIDLLDRLLGHYALGVPAHLSRAPIIDTIVSNALQFWLESNASIAQAVAETATSTQVGSRLTFVPSPYTEKNSLFGTDPWLFGFSPTLETEDEVSYSRDAACQIRYPGLGNILQRETCHFASVGHPNAKGAQAYAAAILKNINLV